MNCAVRGELLSVASLGQKPEQSDVRKCEKAQCYERSTRCHMTLSVNDSAMHRLHTTASRVCERLLLNRRQQQAIGMGHSRSSSVAVRCGGTSRYEEGRSGL